MPLPFDRCAAHVGGEGWGKDGVSYGDLQVRVYDLGEPANAVEQRIEKEASTDVERFSGQKPDVKHDRAAAWNKTVFAFPRWYGDYGATAHVDFRVRRLGTRTFVFVFMYSSYDLHAKEIVGILDSFSAK
jgi:hypothetical protein